MPDKSQGSQELLPKDALIYVAGHRGLAGGAIWRELLSQGYKNLIGASSQELDLRDKNQTFAYFEKHKPNVVIDAAAKVGGILANNSYPAEFLSDNLHIQLNIMDASNHFDINRLLFLGSSCIYPKFAEQPIKESSLLTGALEPTNDAYAIAKIAGIMQVQASRRQYGRQWISAMPTNLYGPGDNFHPENSHVLPAIIRRFHEATIQNAKEVVLWGTGTPRREFLHVTDLAKACIFLLENYDSPETINIGVGNDVTIRQLAEIVAATTGFKGEIVQDTSKPDGTPRKLLDVTKLRALGWKETIGLEEGIKETYKWFVAHENDLRVK